MLRPRAKRLAWLTAVLLAGLSLFVLGQGMVSALSNGSISGRSQSGCGTCHSSNPSPGVTVAIQGPTEVKTGEKNSYTVELSGAPTKGGGLNLSVSGGELSPGNNAQLVRGEITHTDRQSRSWTFQWTAPKAPGPVTMYAAGNSTNNDGSPAGDAWNLAALTIQVADAAPVASATETPPQPAAPASGPVQFTAISQPGPAPISLALEAPKTWVAGQPMTLQATLADAQGQPIVGETVQFFTRSQFFIEDWVAIGQGKTDPQGNAKLSYTPRNRDETIVSARYTGNQAYGPNQAEFTVVVEPLSPLYQPQAGLSLPLIGPWLLALVIGTIWSIYFFVWYQILRISQG